MTWFVMHPEITGLALVIVLCLISLAIGFHLGEASAKVDAILEELRPESQRTDTSVIDWNTAPEVWRA